QFDQTKLNIVNRQRLLGLLVEAPQRLRRAGRLPFRTGKGEGPAAASDGHVERGFDLPQIGVERSAEVGKQSVVERREGHVLAFPSAAHRTCPPSLCRLSGPAPTRLGGSSAPSTPLRAYSTPRRDGPGFPCRDWDARARSAVASAASGRSPVAETAS